MSGDYCSQQVNFAFGSRSDMLLRAQLKPKDSIELNRQFLEYQKHFGEAQRIGKDLLQRLSK